ncbi:hypothetical protein DOTSEDRAFT_37935 [Dothistroma septosporum NZE10]|uniref:Uncharacterized protein n=1 Tax=Dothistroma septosporum (strain NZE10 / CBS 128990) TaxID=675120 RepID=N1PBZ6_DOTSN|nr:hypothetical protein DOTSEDRAFT_37935 [Dothistroma septosporum NZE10]
MVNDSIDRATSRLSKISCSDQKPTMQDLEVRLKDTNITPVSSRGAEKARAYPPQRAPPGTRQMYKVIKVALKKKLSCTRTMPAHQSHLLRSSPKSSLRIEPMARLLAMSSEELPPPPYSSISQRDVTARAFVTDDERGMLQPRDAVLTNLSALPRGSCGMHPGYFCEYHHDTHIQEQRQGTSGYQHPQVQQVVDEDVRAGTFRSEDEVDAWIPYYVLAPDDTQVVPTEKWLLPAQRFKSRSGRYLAVACSVTG